MKSIQSVFITVYGWINAPINILVILLFTIGLCILQFSQSKNRNLLGQTNIEIIEQIQRMNDYPPKFYRMANILENRPESRLSYKLQKNFFSSLDINQVPFFLLPFLFIGSMHFISKKQAKLIYLLLVFPVITITLIGTAPNVPNYCLYPFIIYSSLNGLLVLLKA